MMGSPNKPLEPAGAAAALAGSRSKTLGRHERGIHMRMTRRWPACLILLLASGCGQAGRRVEGQLPPVTIGVCEAAKSHLGARIRVQGEFGGINGAWSNYTPTVVMLSTNLCDGTRGAGLVFATLVGREEAAKLGSRRPRDDRYERTGDPVEIDGFVTKVEEGRFTYLQDCIVVR
jgi:hypothetical protein